MTELNRRNVLMASGTAVTVGLAGCIGGGGGDGNGNGDSATPEEQVDSHLDGANGYDGTDSIADETGSGTATIMVGAGDNGLSFDPAAVRVDSGTEVTWEWTGEGGDHNVNVQEGPETFENDEGVIGDEGHEFTRTLETTGAYRYQCDPHAASGMLGAVIVE